MRALALALVLVLAASSCGDLGFDAPYLGPTYCGQLESFARDIGTDYRSRFGVEPEGPLADQLAATVPPAEAHDQLARIMKTLAAEPAEWREYWNNPPPYLPSDVVVAHVVVARLLEERAEQLRTAASGSPESFGGSVIGAMADQHLFEVVDAWAHDRCNVHIFGTAPVSADLPETEDLLAGTGLTTGRDWTVSRRSPVLCNGTEAWATSKQWPNATGDHVDLEVMLWWQDSVPTPSQAHDHDLNCQPEAESVRDLRVVVPDGLTVEAHQYKVGGLAYLKDRNIVYISDGEVLVRVSDYHTFSRTSDPSPKLFTDIATQIAANVANR